MSDFSAIRDTSIITNGAPFYAFEFPFPDNPEGYEWGAGPTIEHLQTHQLHLLCELEDGDRVEMAPEAGELKWTLNMAGEDSDDA